MCCCAPVFAASYPTESQLRSALLTGATVLKDEGLELEMRDAHKEGLKLSLLAAGLNLETGVCMVFYNPQPAEGLKRFFDTLDDKDLPVWLDAMAVHEATHCIEQREAYLRQRFAKVLPPDIEPEHMTLQGYLSVVKSGAVETWGEALADIASVLYLRQRLPRDWIPFAQGIAALRQELARQWPEHDTSAWLQQILAAPEAGDPRQNIFEAAFRLRRQYQPK